MPIDSALLELARNPGLTDLAEEIILDLQSMTVEELDLKTISEVHVPAEEIDQAVSAVVGDDDWRRALRRFGTEGSPDGRSRSQRGHRYQGGATVSIEASLRYTDDRRAPGADPHGLHRARQATS
jgi:hypothetical protein